MVTGYQHPDYADSLAEFGKPRALGRCGGWILERAVPGFSSSDATGCYPMFVCRDWSRLAEDLHELGRDLVSVSLVADPFGNFEMKGLQSTFDVVIPFKERFVIDLNTPLDQIGSDHHRYYARKGLKQVRVEHCPEPGRYLDEWVRLYAHMVARFNLRGIKAFSREAFRKQLEVPGLVMFRADLGGETVGLDLWYVKEDVAYGHLVAYSPVVYRTRASYALKWTLIQYFAGKVRWIDLGADTGLNATKKTGLSQFKEGWATGTRTTYFCGRILHREAYSDLVRATPGAENTSYFPAYRAGELG